MSHFTPSSKTAMHQGFAAMHLNLFAMAPCLFPHLAVIDGFEAMEGNGPTDGDKVDWRVALASTDWLTADVTAARMMGFSVEEIGYLHYCTKANYGVSSQEHIDIIGNVEIDEVSREFKRHDISRLQNRWRSPAATQCVEQSLAGSG